MGTSSVFGPCSQDLHCRIDSSYWQVEKEEFLLASIQKLIFNLHLYLYHPEGNHNISQIKNFSVTPIKERLESDKFDKSDELDKPDAKRLILSIEKEMGNVETLPKLSAFQQIYRTIDGKTAFFILSVFSIVKLWSGFTGQGRRASLGLLILAGAVMMIYQRKFPSVFQLFRNFKIIFSPKKHIKNILRNRQNEKLERLNFELYAYFISHVQFNSEDVDEDEEEEEDDEDKDTIEVVVK